MEPSLNPSRPSGQREIARRGGVVVLAASLNGCSGLSTGVLAAEGPIAAAQGQNMVFVAGLVALVIIPLFLALPVVLWRYRLRGARGEYRPDWEFSWPLEFAIWGIPVLIVAILGWNLWGAAHRLDPYRPVAARAPPLDVQVVALDWKFLFIYPDQDIAAINRLVIPADRNIRLSMTSDATMQSLLIPKLGGQVYMMAGMRTRLNLLADRPGSYRGMNTLFNGRGFHDQTFTVEVMSADAFGDWSAAAKRRPAMTLHDYTALARPSTADAAHVFGGAPVDLFGRIMAKYHRADDTLAVRR